MVRLVGRVASDWVHRTQGNQATNKLLVIHVCVMICCVDADPAKG